MYALSVPEALDEVLATARMTRRSDETMGATTVLLTLPPQWRPS